MKFSYAIVIVSDSTSPVTTDKNGPALTVAVTENFPDAFGPLSCTMVPDKQDVIIAALECLCKHDINLILTMGGSGLQVTDIAMLSRAVFGIKDNSVIVNLPNNLNNALECFGFIKYVVPQLIDLVTHQNTAVKTANSEIKSDEEVVKINEENYEPSCFQLLPTTRLSNVSSYEIVKFNEALDIVRNYTLKYLADVEEIAIEESLNRILAPDDILYKRLDLIIRTSKTNGYAMIASDDKSERSLITSFTNHDDLSPFVLHPGEAVRINAGNCLPKGADAVVPIDDVVVKELKNEIKIITKNAPKCGKYIKSKQVEFTARNVITSTHIGILTALGRSKIKVYKRARVGVLSTGDALCLNIDKDVNGAHVTNSNNLALLNLLKTFGYSANDLGTVNHDPNLLKRALRKAFSHHDVIITTGGISQAEHEVMKNVLSLDFGATILFGRVDIEPGYWTTFATCSFNGSTKFIFSLPGNFNAVLVTSRLFVIPALRRYENAIDDTYRIYKVEVNHRRARHFWSGERTRFMKTAITLKTDSSSANKFLAVFKDDINCSLSYSNAALIIIPENKLINNKVTDILDGIMLYR
ncbi:gephyrin-like [Onthophagus taurus]|uniref:gephyrin-like n=1 Tax=Onthophagus taurus TaxID=166361 RepID=UPI0039BEA227